jgi:alkylation response protein AidB-like acyl-CoA dehydrogenase
MLVAVEAARSIVMYAASSVDQGMDERAVHAAVAKAQTCAAAAKVADSALTLHGAIGYTWEHSLHLFYKRAKVDAVLWGSAATWNERVARSLPLLPT